MTAYPFEEYTTVLIVDTIAVPAAPTVTELNAGLDITCDLTKDGLALVRTTDPISRGLWAQPLNAESPGRHGFSEPTLTGKRRTQGGSEPFWDAATYRGPSRFLVVRRGVLYGTAWATGQLAEVIGFRFGRRSVVESAANTNVTFTVRLFVNLDLDEVTVA